MKINKLSYEEALEELKDILEKLEDNESNLEESLKMFKHAVELYEHCNNILTKTEGEIKILLDKDNTLEEVDFIKEEERNY